MQLLVLISYFIILITLGFSGRKSTEPSDANNYLLAGRKLSLPGFVVTLVSTWYGGIIGIGENTYLYGLQTWIIFGLPYYIFAIILNSMCKHITILNKDLGKINCNILLYNNVFSH